MSKEAIQIHFTFQHSVMHCSARKELSADACTMTEDEILAVILCSFYGILAVVALVVLVRIHYFSKPWTIQKFIHLFIFWQALRT